MGDDMKKIEAYTNALERFEQKGFYQIEEQIERELDNFQLTRVGTRPFASLSGGQKRLVEVVKIMHSQAHLALIDEPTNHMDYVAKQQFIDWMRNAREAMLVITHDRDVLEQVDRIVELKDGLTVSYRGNYDAYLKQNAASTSTGIHDHEMLERRRANLRDKVTQFRRLKERARDPGTIQQFKRREVQAVAELAELEEIEKPTFWIDKNSRESLDFKAASRYDKYKSRNIKMNMKDESSRSSHVLVKAVNVSLGYDTPLFDGVNIDLREGEAVELRGRNGAGKSTLIKALLSGPRRPNPRLFAGELLLDPHTRVGVYEQEATPTYFELTLHDAIERTYSDQQLSVSETKIRQLAADYLFTEADLATPVEKLSGGQKARLQIIAMLANDPQLLILDEPTNHLDLPSIEELETALAHYGGAVLFVSHDGYFRETLGGDVIKIGV
jgi:ATPase subunit of ABC transporter with duplicated ATPase domains